MCAAGRGTTEQVTNPLDPLLLRLSEDFIDDEDLSRRLKRLFKVTQPRRGPSKRRSTCTDPPARHGHLACRRPAPCADLKAAPGCLRRLTAAEWEWHASRAVKRMQAATLGSVVEP